MAVTWGAYRFAATAVHRSKRPGASIGSASDLEESNVTVYVKPSHGGASACPTAISCRFACDGRLVPARSSFDYTKVLSWRDVVEGDPPPRDEPAERPPAKANSKPDPENPPPPKPSGRRLPKEKLDQWPVNFRNSPTVRSPCSAVLCGSERGTVPVSGAVADALIGQKTAAGSARRNVPGILPAIRAFDGQRIDAEWKWRSGRAETSQSAQLDEQSRSGRRCPGHTLDDRERHSCNAGTLSVYVGGEKISIGVAAADTNANVAAPVGRINLGYYKFGRNLAFPVIASVATT